MGRGYTGRQLLSLFAACALLSFTLPSLSAAQSGYLAPDWIRTFGTPGADQGWGVDTGPEGEVYVTGFVQGQGNDVFLARLDPSGIVSWETTWNRPLSQKAFEVEYANGFLYVGGISQRDFTIASQDMLLLKVAPSNGTLLWNVT